MVNGPSRKPFQIIMQHGNVRENRGDMSQIHAKTDKLSLVAVPEKDGKMRVTSLSWDDPLHRHGHRRPRTPRVASR